MFLSSSVFAGPEWKRTALTIAKMAIDSGPGDELLSGKWRLRAQVISRLYPAELGNYHVNDAGWNDLQGNQTLFEVQNLIFSGDFDYAWQLLEKLQSLLGPSTLEQRVRHKIDLFKSKICRLKGDFAAALEHLKGMPSAIITYKGLIPNYRSLLMELYCELGKTDDAACWIPAVDITSLSWLGLKGSGRRISLAAANTRFMEGFNMLGKDRMAFDRANELLHAAKMIYKELDKTFQDLPPSRVTHFRQFSVSAGLAMIAHLESHDQSENLKEAYTRWQSTLVVAERMRKCCAWDPGFAETVIAFSMSDITHRLGWREQTAKLMKEGKCLYLKTGRQFGWFALGTVWFDAVGDWLEGAGFSRIDERLDDWRSKRQNCNAK